MTHLCKFLQSRYSTVVYQSILFYFRQARQYVECVTSVGSRSRRYHVQLIMAPDVIIATSNTKYRYVKDPIITSVAPMKGIMSGGLRNTIVGQRLNSVKKMDMVILYIDQQYIGVCYQCDPGMSLNCAPIRVCRNSTHLPWVCR